VEKVVQNKKKRANILNISPIKIILFHLQGGKWWKKWQMVERLNFG